MTRLHSSMPALIDGPLGVLFVAHLSDLQGREGLSGAGQAANGPHTTPATEAGDLPSQGCKRLSSGLQQAHQTDCDGTPSKE